MIAWLTTESPTTTDKVVVNRQTKWGLCGYVQRGKRKNYMKWVNMDQALDEWRIYYHDLQFINKLEGKK